MNNRRRLLAVAFAVSIAMAPFGSSAQKAAQRFSAIGVLNPGSVAGTAHLQEALKQGLRERGYVEGKNITLEFRYGESKADRLPGLAADLVRSKVDLIVAPTDAAIAAAAKRENFTKRPTADQRLSNAG